MFVLVGLSAREKRFENCRFDLCCRSCGSSGGEASRGSGHAEVEMIGEPCLEEEEWSTGIPVGSYLRWQMGTVERVLVLLLELEYTDSDQDLSTESCR